MYRLVISIILIFVCGCSARQVGHGDGSSVLFNDTRLLMDTYCTIVIHGNADSGLLDEAFELCAELEALLSITIESSDVWRINNAAGEPVSVDTRTIEVIKAGLALGKISNGMFDITIGRLSRLWDFQGQGDGSTVSLLPAPSEIEKSKATIDYTQVQIDGDAVRLKNQDAWIDLGAIAKGYIADWIVELLKERGVSGALIDLGGDVITIGNRPGGDPWRVALRKPFGSADEWVGIVEVSDAAVVSSGTYERQFEVDGITYHHILDPTTGKPVITDVAGATVIAEDALIGEGLSTIAVLLGSERAPVYFEQTPGFIGAVLVLNNGEVLLFGDFQFTKV